METAKKTSFASALTVGLKLLLICGLVAGIVTGVYNLTAEPYEENLKKTKAEAIATIFGRENLTVEEAADGISRVLENGELLGYSVESTGAGFGGDLELTVGYGADGKIVGVSVISNSETPGVGSKAMDANYLKNYNQKSGKVTLGSGLDAISGATISSKAVNGAVNAATEKLEAFLKGGDAS